MKKNFYKPFILVIIIASVLLLSNCDDNTDDPDYILNVVSLKEHFKDHFLIGNIMNPGSVASEKLKHHYNVLTAENDMKPDKINPNRGSYNFRTADNMVKTAIDSGFLVVGHTLLWHSQIPSWHRSVNSSNAKGYMETYIKDVVGHFKGKIYSWDVINEAFPDGGYNGDWKTSMRNENPWYSALGSDFVYYSFLAARQADSGAILYYNDYNLNMSSKAKMVHDMVRDVNIRYKNAYPGADRLLIEGIGMQGHHNTCVTAASIKASIDLFRQLGVRISISELDVLSQTWSEYSAQNALTETGKTKAAQLYGDYFKVFIANSDIIERVTFWGVNDSESWRSRAAPLIFSGDMAKSSYHKIIDSLK